MADNRADDAAPVELAPGAICEYLVAVVDSDIRRLIINVPPRSGKSIFGQHLTPCWIWVRYPSSRLMFASYSAALYIDLSVNDVR